MATADIRGLRRTGSAGVGGTASGILNTNEYDTQLIAQEMPAYAEMTRMGQGWATMSTSAVAGLVVRPSTTAAVEIWNGYNAGGPSLIIDRLFAFNLVSTNVIEGFSLWAQVTASKAAPSSTVLTVRGNSGKAYGGSVATGVSTTVVDSGWFPWTETTSKGAGGVVPFGAQVVNVEGRLIVPPGSSLCLHIVSSLVGQTFTQGASWYERTITTL
jgi:hypothetical protein